MDHMDHCKFFIGPHYFAILNTEKIFMLLQLFMINDKQGFKYPDSAHTWHASV